MPPNSDRLTEARIETLFALLDRWRHFPAYRLEPRVDIFFALYLKEIVEQYIGGPLVEPIIPEFPLRQGTLWGESARSPNKSVKVDYLLVGKSSPTVYLLELKTDVESRRDVQDNYLERAKQVGFRSLLDGVLTIVNNTTYRSKYVHLLHAVAELGMLHLPQDLFDYAFPKSRVGITQALRQVRNLIIEPEPEIRVLYLQPTSHTEQKVIDFEFCAEVVSKYDDPISAAFARNLRRWSTDAGSIAPK